MADKLKEFDNDEKTTFIRAAQFALSSELPLAEWDTTTCRRTAVDAAFQAVQACQQRLFWPHVRYVGE